jgi:hypothetical protein
METPKYLINDYLKDASNLEELRNILYEKGVQSKDYMEDGLILLYHKYNNPISNELERECRSLVLDRETLQMKSYSCETPYLNNEGLEYLLYNHSNPQIINTCYEGTYLSVFYHNNKWYVSTRRCLNSYDSLFNIEVSHYDMFNEVITNSGYIDFYDFSTKLDKTKSYYFVLIHHLNKNIIDYTELFGENYGKLCLTTIRDENMNELDLYNNYDGFVSQDINDNIFIPERLESLENFTLMNNEFKYTEKTLCEGVVVRVWDNNMNKYHIVKLQNINYQFNKIVGKDNNIFKGLVYLYQNNKLLNYFENNQNMRKIINPKNNSETYDTIGVIDSVFKVCTSEIFELFKMLWSIKTGKRNENVKLYNFLPKEYKDILFAVRGLYFKKKATLFDTENKNVQNAYLKINDIYNYLKSLSTETFLAFLRMRKLMLNWIKLNNELIELSSINRLCDKLHLKMCAIFTNKLYPNIISSDIPPQKELALN